MLTDAFSPQTTQVIQRELQPGERILWTGQPDPRCAASKSLPLLLFAIPWTAFSVFWTVAAGYGVSQTQTGWAYLFPLWGLPFIAVGLGMLSAPVWAFRAAKKTIYVLTDQRALSISAGRSRTVKSLEYVQFGEMIRRERNDGTGDLVLKETWSRDSDGDRVKSEFAFVGIPDVKKVEELARSLTQGRRRV